MSILLRIFALPLLAVGIFLFLLGMAYGIFEDCFQRGRDTYKP